MVMETVLSAIKLMLKKNCFIWEVNNSIQEYIFKFIYIYIYIYTFINDDEGRWYGSIKDGKELFAVETETESKDAMLLASSTGIRPD